MQKYCQPFNPTCRYRLKRGSPVMKCKNHQTLLMNHCEGILLTTIILRCSTFLGYYHQSFVAPEKDCYRLLWCFQPIMLLSPWRYSPFDLIGSFSYEPIALFNIFQSSCVHEKFAVQFALGCPCTKTRVKLLIPVEEYPTQGLSFIAIFLEWWVP